MAVLVTRPHPDDEATATALRAKGFEVMLAPMLRFEPVAFHDDEDARYGAVVVTSANALRGIALIQGSRLLKLPLSRGGRAYRLAAHRAGSTTYPGKRRRRSLRDSVLASVKAKEAEGQPAALSGGPIWRAILPANSANAVSPLSPTPPTG
jgi:uroporphyrinogen-III synthase